jgi:hypothetical protein
MKLENTMVILAALLIAGCRGETSIEKLGKKLDASPNMRFKIECLTPDGRRIPTVIERAEFDNYRFKNAEFESCVNSRQGYLELDHVEQLYVQRDWVGRFFAGLSKLSPGYAESADIFGLTKFSTYGGNKYPWKLIETKDGVDKYRKMIEVPGGVAPVDVSTDKEGNMKYFKSPFGFEYTVQSVESGVKFASDTFDHVIPDGYAYASVDSETVRIQVGQTFDISRLSRGKDVANWKPSGFHLFAVLEPSEPNYETISKWVAKTQEGFTKIPLRVGKQESGFFNVSGAQIHAWTTSLPLFVLVNKDMKIIALWMGFDSAGTEFFEKDIRQAILDR